MRVPCVSSLLNVSKAAGHQKKKGNRQKSESEKKPQKINFYSTQRMTCGSHEPAGSSTFQTWHEIERKRQVTEYQEPKIIQEKKLDCTQRMACGSHLAAAVSPFERLHGIKRKSQVTKYQEPKIIQEKKLYCTQRMTCGSHFAAAVSMFEMRLEIKRKRKQLVIRG